VFVLAGLPVMEVLQFATTSYRILLVALLGACLSVVVCVVVVCCRRRCLAQRRRREREHKLRQQTKRQQCCIENDDTDSSSGQRLTCDPMTRIDTDDVSVRTSCISRPSTNSAASTTMTLRAAAASVLRAIRGQ